MENYEKIDIVPISQMCVCVELQENALEGVEI